MFDFQGSHLDTDAVTPAGEEAMAARNDDGGPAVRATVAMETRAGYRHHGRSGLQ